MLGELGLWRGGPLLTPEIARVAERLGYGTVWVGGSPASDLTQVEELLDATERITVATGIVNIWTAPAKDVAASFHGIEQAHPGRFVLGVGIGHRENQGDVYQRPYAALVDYLDVLDAEGVPVHRRMISALGPRTLRLAAERSAGTHPYMTTSAHTRFARSVIGAESLIAVEQRLVLDEDADAARATARRFLARYLSLTNYRRTLESHGSTASDLDDGATDAAVDALAPHGSADVLTAAVRAQQEAGADHVCVQFLSPREDPTRALEVLAEEYELGD
ncbi:TIGR03620 family F420-dependent LLM class oxidoreductase [Microbacterium alcoholitolerans]|uniref:TIGR03620 family F420-dependent LLM class oxidoreductase n=1 Tax=unclassified Microbacterium TaxID=2609290 RepID=UPI003D16D5F5